MNQTYGEDDNGRSVDLKISDSFDLRLSESSMGGYRWKLVESGAPVLKAEEASLPVTDTSMPGGHNRRSWHFTAQQPGKVQLHLLHLRSWQPHAPGAEFRLNVNVEA